MSQGDPESQVDGTCYFCDHAANASVYYVQRPHIIARLCGCCVHKVNNMAKVFGNELRFWIALGDEEAAVAAQGEPVVPLAEGDAALAVTEAMNLLKQKYQKEHASDAKDEETSGASSAPNEGEHSSGTTYLF